MTSAYQPESPEVLKKIYRLFRDYFDLAEKKRRWSIKDDIPWTQCNRSLNPAIADVVETFAPSSCTCRITSASSFPRCGPTTAVPGCWPIGATKKRSTPWRSATGCCAPACAATAMADLEGAVFSHEWDLPWDNSRAMVCYTAVQELATWLHYYNLRERLAAEGGDPALYRVLTLVSLDERAHYDFFRRLVMLYLEDDREGTLEQLRRVVNDFHMPAVHLMADSRKRTEEVKKLRIFDYDIYYFQVFEPVLKGLGLEKSDLRRRARREVMPPTSAQAEEAAAGPPARPSSC